MAEKSFEQEVVDTAATIRPYGNSAFAKMRLFQVAVQLILFGRPWSWIQSYLERKGCKLDKRQIRTYYKRFLEKPYGQLRQIGELKLRGIPIPEDLKANFIIPSVESVKGIEGKGLMPVSQDKPHPVRVAGENGIVIRDMKELGAAYEKGYIEKVNPVPSNRPWAGNSTRRRGMRNGRKALKDGICFVSEDGQSAERTPPQLRKVCSCGKKAASFDQKYCGSCGKELTLSFEVTPNTKV